ncbi:MAG TPA: cytochrome P450 [Acidimicrobiales bacterium]|nr:cytochrome P450 [Acidimicrobiales bacterium]
MAPTPFEFVPFGRRFARDPYAVYDRMREAGDLLRTPYGFYVAHRYADVRQVHGDHHGFSMGALGASMGSMMAGGEPGADQGGMGGGDFMMAQTMLTTDPPDHERLRRVVNRAFTPSSIADLEPRIRAITRELLAPLAAGDPFDIVADFAAPLPTIVIAELLGIPAADGDKFRRWTEVVTGTDVRGSGADDAGGGGVRNRYGAELRAYLAEQIERRKTEPTDDLIGRMVVANRDQVMTDAEVVASCILLLIAGNETTMRLITNMTLALGRHPEQLERLVQDPDLIPSGVEETLRYDSPVQMLFRGVKQPTRVGADEVPTGASVLTMLAAANRDPAAFPDADVYDVGRTDNLHVSFGHGIHYCLGAPLARRETRLAFEELLQLAPRYEVLTPDDELEYPQMIFLRSPRSLVIKPAA